MSYIDEAVKLHKTGDFKKAEEAYRRIIEHEPQNHNAMNLLGVLLMQTGRLYEAHDWLKKAVELNNCAAYLENLGLLHFCVKDYYKAAQYYQEALLKEPLFETCEQIIKCYENLKDYKNALKYSLIILEKHPKNLEIIRKIAFYYNKLEDYQNAVKFYKLAVEMEPNDYVGYNNWGLAAEKLQDFDRARVCYIKSLKIKENYEALHNLGVLARAQRKFDESIRLLTRALVLKPDSEMSKMSLGMAYFSIKDFQNGKKYYSQRNTKLKHNFKNEWDGQKHPGKTLLVYFEGGYGDQLMFCRYFKYLKEYFAKIKILVYPGLTTLFKKNFPDFEISNDPANVEYDYSVNVMEIHYALNMDFEHIPVSESYLSVDTLEVEKFKKKFFDNNKRKIGLFWQGNKKVFQNRSIKLKQFASLFELQNTEFYSFEKDEKEKQILDFPQIIDLEPDLKTFIQTAAGLKNLDVLITIDSAIAHLAGALGVKTFLLLPYASEWRWFSDTETTPWYPSVKIFKQEKPNSWEEVIYRVYNALRP